MTGRVSSEWIRSRQGWKTRMIHPFRHAANDTSPARNDAIRSTHDTRTGDRQRILDPSRPASPANDRQRY